MRTTITRRRADLTTMRPKSRAALVPPTVLNPSRRVLTPRPRPTSQPEPRLQREAQPTQADQAIEVGRQLTAYLWANRREPNLWLTVVVSVEILVLVGLLIAYRLLAHQT